MPCYTYKCEHCSTEFEAIVSKPDPNVLQPCPQCKEMAPTFIPQGKRGLKFLFNYQEP